MRRRLPVPPPFLCLPSFHSVMILAGKSGRFMALANPYSARLRTLGSRSLSVPAWRIAATSASLTRYCSSSNSAFNAGVIPTGVVAGAGPADAAAGCAGTSFGSAASADGGTASSESAMLAAAMESEAASFSSKLALTSASDSLHMASAGGTAAFSESAMTALSAAAAVLVASASRVSRRARLAAARAALAMSPGSEAASAGGVRFEARAAASADLFLTADMALDTR